MITLTIHCFDHRRARLELSRQGRVFDAVDFSVDSDFDTMLIDNVDKILKRNRIDPLSVFRGVAAGQVDEYGSMGAIARSSVAAIEATRPFPAGSP